ncbi:response regulator [Echinimonas agarilytica]|uniref:Response regulator transcription factor n=1 Tax=Echinimonas agarilytica TaxID=1215918 RepID=A0AA42B7H8_9GAMM|nr:response regulator transcription factor [Echinimonas agarilytica]MCM2680065.1 response regulator transcription factor [Echinimonas agarilytica]
MRLADQIIIADDHPLFRQALMLTLKTTPELTDVDWLEADTVGALEKLLEQHADADLLVLDLQIPGAHGFSTLVHVRSHFPDLPVVVVSAHEEEDNIRRAMHAGAAGFVPKSSAPEVLQQALIAILQGQIWVPNDAILSQAVDDDIVSQMASLTPQQHRILMMFAEGMLNKQIASDLNVSEATVKAHATAIFKKLNVRNRTQAVIAISQLDLSQFHPQ